MRKPRDIDAELRDLAQKAKALKVRRVTQLGEVVIAAGAGDLDPEVVAGIILSALKTQTPERLGEWKRDGAAFFRGSGSAPSAVTTGRDPASAQENPRPDASGRSGQGQG